MKKELPTTNIVLPTNVDQLIPHNPNTEYEYMHAVTLGDADTACKVLSMIQNRYRNEQKDQYTQKRGISGFAVVRTLARLSAKSAGVSADILQSITKHYEFLSFQMTETDEFLDLGQKLTRDLCKQVQIYIGGQYSAVVRQAIGFIHLHYQEDLTVQDIAAHCGVTAAKISALFNKEMNTTIPAYITQHRLSQATQLLLQGEVLISKIGSMVGIVDHSYFTKLFKKQYGMSPSEYRKQGKQRDV